MGSTVLAIRASLAEALADAMPPDALVVVGHPHPLPQVEKLVVVGPATRRELAYVHGLAAANESYSLEVVVSVVAPAEAPYSDVAAVAYAMADAAVAAVAAWAKETGPSLGAAALVASAEESELLADAVRECAIVLQVDVKARASWTSA